MNREQQFAARVMQPSDSADLATTPTERTVRLHELRSLFEAFLPSATEEEIQRVFHLQGEMEIQHARLGGLLQRQLIDHREYASSLNREVSWSLRQCAEVLGEGRTRELFGISGIEHVMVVDPSLMEPVVSQVGSSWDIHEFTSNLIDRYSPRDGERSDVLKALKTVDPQRKQRVSLQHWTPGGRYSPIVANIAAAEDAYRSGSLEASIGYADNVMSGVSELETISDMPLYLSAWAHHIQGRCYEAFTDWRRASLHYECSLKVKIALHEWLPPLPGIATEIKLGIVELSQSPIESVTRLARVADVLSSQGRLEKENKRLYRNLLEDSRIGLAEAYLATGNVDLAIIQAKSALNLAKALKDQVGEIRILAVLARTEEIPGDEAREHIRGLILRNERLRTHPRVAIVIRAMDLLSEQSE